MKLVVIGDSITEGYPFSHRDSWVEYLAKELKFEVINKGINGDFTGGMLERFERDVLSCSPSHTIILGGANDAYEQIPLQDVSNNFTGMLELCEGHEIIPIIGLPSPSLLAEEESLLMEYRKWLIEFADKRRLGIIDFFTPFHLQIKAGGSEELFVDEVHPSLKGYALMGRVAVETWKSWY